MGFLNSIFFIIFPILINQFILNLAKDLFSPGDELNSTSTLVSAGGIFTLGFFTTKVTISDRNLSYLGIWYTNDDIQNRKVWVSNRFVPMDSNGVLVIDESGNLKVIRGGGNNTILFNVSNSKQVVGSGNNTRAVLDDSGNFILYDVTNGNRTLWQSFDHPTDTLIPGMKLGYNLTVKKIWTLTSGDFTMRLEQIQNSHQLVIYNWDDKVYWSSGPWENGTFQAWRSYPKLYRIKLSLISDATGMFFTYQTIASPLSMLVLTSRGNLVDTATNIDLTPTFCYESYNNGCAIPTCRGQGDRFRQRRGTWILTNSFSQDFDDRVNFTVNDCMNVCWSQYCVCKGIAMKPIPNGTRCILFSGEDSRFIPNELTEVQYVLVSEQHPDKQHPKKKTWIWVLCVAIVLTSILTAALCYVRIRRRKREDMRTMEGTGSIGVEE